MTRFVKFLVVTTLAVPLMAACAQADPLGVDRDADREHLEFQLPGDRNGGTQRLDGGRAE